MVLQLSIKALSLNTMTLLTQRFSNVVHRFKFILLHADKMPYSSRAIPFLLYDRKTCDSRFSSLPMMIMETVCR